MLPCSCFRRFSNQKQRIINMNNQSNSFIRLAQFRYCIRDKIKQLRFELLELSAGNIKDENFGICANLTLPVQDLFSNCAVFWPKFSGDYIYPIPGGREEYKFAKEQGLLWSGYQREMRMELMAFIIDELDKATGQKEM